MFVMSPVNAVNSIAALKWVVYDQAEASLAEVKAACSANFTGSERLRQQLLAAPKWGNDDDYVDLLGAQILEFACACIRDERIDAKAGFLSGIHQPHQVSSALHVGATPDGRRAGEAYPVTLSPANGTDGSGPTAALRSVAKIDPLACQWNHALLLTLHPSAVSGPDGPAKLEALIRTYHRLGGIQLQMNVVDADTLREAQLAPERHRDLVVRVWGFTARFVDLQPCYQQDLIRRTAHAV